MESAKSPPSSPTYPRWLATSLLLATSLFAGCAQDADPNPTPANSGSGGTLNSPADTTANRLNCTVPEPGCLCDEEGQHMPCGKVTITQNGQMSCGKGVSVCANGKWEECILTNLDPLPEEEAPPGYYKAQAAQTPTPCDNNPCNPYCYDFPGNPDAGIGDSGSDVVVVDGGIGTVWDASNTPCVPLTKAVACAGKDCGEVANGCGGTICCGTTCSTTAPEACPVAGQVCGGAGVPNKCGTTPLPNCTKVNNCPAPKVINGKTFSACGWVPDGCGGVTACGTNGTCGSGQTCGLNGANICGDNCTPKTCAQQGKNCGLTSDGCGNTLNCGTCPTGQFCGAFSANVCWGPGACTPKTFTQACTNAGKNCGQVADGCGGTVDCGTCASGLCGAGGVPNVCGGAVCVPKTAAQACTNAGKDCGPVSDGCGGTINCGVCQYPKACGGAGVPNQCGFPSNCTNLCQKQVACPNNGTTTITGKVFAPNGIHPLPNAVVYVPNAAVPAFPNGLTCENCAQAGGSPLVSTTTATDGTFTLNNMPVGSNIPLVIQIGRWRRQVVIPQVNACTTTSVLGASTTITSGSNAKALPQATINVASTASFPAGTQVYNIRSSTGPQSVVCTGKTATTLTGCTGGLGTINTNNAVVLPFTRFPRTQAEGDIPMIAVSTGGVDGMECVLRRMGVADSEFTNPGGGGRINFYKGYNNAGSTINGSTPVEGNLLGSLGTLDNFDMILFPCQGTGISSYGSNALNTGYQKNIADYVNTGGRAFMTHYNIRLLKTATPTWSSSLSSAINIINEKSVAGSDTGLINTTFARGQQLANWLMLADIGASTVLGQIGINAIRNDFNGFDANNTVNWLTISNRPTHVTFDTPLNVPLANKCGRVVFSDFHVYDVGTSGKTFPNECPANTAMSPQEKLLEYMIFDLSSCVGAATPPAGCSPLTCAQQGITCGQAGDGCGGTLTCGAACPTPNCTPKTCAQQGFNCGLASDGCGGTINCGTCASNQLCGGIGNVSPNQCVNVQCTKEVCPVGSGTYCGAMSDGCGGTLNCTCTTSGETCGGGGIPSQCGKACVKNTCPSGPGAFCGQMPDGCGGTLSCGCTLPETCGGGGVTAKCGKPTCTPNSCAAQDIECGQAGDGCGNIVGCGTCPAPLTCGGAGVPGKCGFVKVHSDGFFTRDYAANCPSGTAPYWQLWSWTAVTPNDSYLDFTVQTSDTEAGLATAPADALRFSQPPGPNALVSQIVKVQKGTPDTQIGAASVDNTLMLNGRKRNSNFLRIKTHIAPTSDKTDTALLKLWDMQVDCLPSE